MSFGITLIAFIVLAVFFGLFFAALFYFIKIKYENWKVKRKDKKIIDEIKGEKEKYKEVKNAREKEFSRRRERDRSFEGRVGYGSKSNNSSSNKDSSSEQWGIQIPSSVFTLRD